MRTLFELHVPIYDVHILDTIHSQGLKVIVGFTAAEVKVQVNNVHDQKVAVLLDTHKPTGYHTVEFDGRHFSFAHIFVGFLPQLASM